MDISKIQQIVAWVSAANLAQFELQSADFSLRLNRPRGAVPLALAVVPVATPAVAPAPEPVAAMATVCGRFLSRHPSRDSPEVKPGDVIAAGDLVGLIAVGEVLLPVTAAAGGTVGAFMVADHQLVGYGTPLLSLVDSARA